jgi:hypothetical protein
MEHTPEPWIAFSTDKKPDTIRSEKNGKVVCQLHDGGFNYDLQEANARRIVAAVNYCAGVPTHELESQGADAGFWGRACSRIERKNKRLEDENARLRAAVTEMERMLPVLEYFVGDGRLWDDATIGTGIANINAY